MPRTRPPLLLAIVLIALGLLIAFGSGLSMFILNIRFIEDVHYFAVPDTVELRLEPGAPMILSREIIGPHDAVNRPVLPPPDDLAVTITNADDHGPIPTQPHDWWMRNNFLGHFANERRGVVRFDAPDHGRVRIAVAGSFPHEQIYSVGPAYQVFVDRYDRALQAGMALGGVLCVAGLGLCILRLAHPATNNP